MQEELQREGILRAMEALAPQRLSSADQVAILGMPEGSSRDIHSADHNAAAKLYTTIHKILAILFIFESNHSL